MLTFLNWDSRKFGYKVFKIDASNISPSTFQRLLEEAKRKGAKLIYVFASLKDVLLNRAIKNTGGILVDRKITYIFNISQKYREHEAGKEIESYLFRRPSKKLLSLCFQAGLYSRFKVDRNFKNNEFKIVYTAWLKNSLNKKIALDLMVYKKDKKIVGFITLGKKNSVADIELIAVNENYRGQGIGKKLVKAALKRAFRFGFRKMQVITQMDNVSACKFYENFGFKLKSVINVYHLWLNG